MQADPATTSFPDGVYRAEMGQKVFILKMAGERVEMPNPAPELSNEELLEASRERLAEVARTALIHPPGVERQP